jgi:hypothetical protein
MISTSGTFRRVSLLSKEGHMRDMKKHLTLLLIIVTLVSCAPWRMKYLTEGVNQLTMDDVAKTLGPPDSSLTLDDGSVIWKYRYTSSSMSGSQYGVSGSTKCTEYILTFDKEKVLRQTRRQRC